MVEGTLALSSMPVEEPLLQGLILHCLRAEGRVEEGTLHCSYHGWRFDASGRCTHIPQVSGKAAATACASQNSCVASFPTQACSDSVNLRVGVFPSSYQSRRAQ